MEQINLLAKPCARQLEWQNMELGVIIHWLADIYNPEFKGYKNKEVVENIPLEIINPKKLDTEQWVRSAYELGAKYAVLVANHCTGFSLWPTKDNEYSTENMKTGPRDVVREFIDACKKYDIKPGLYYSTGCNGRYDINDEKKHDYNAMYYREYVSHVEAQLTELWSNYGELFEIWFDGGVVPHEKGGPDVAGLLKKYQPGAITFQGPKGWTNNIRWVGNEDGFAPEDCFCACSEDGRLEGDPFGEIYCPAESDFPNRTHKGFGGGWAWRAGEEDCVIPPQELFECYLKTVGRNTNMLLGMAISTDGDFKDEEQFIALGKLIKEAFSDPIKASFVKEGNVYSAGLNGEKARFAVIRENLEDGQRITGFNLIINGEIYKSGRSIGNKRIIELGGMSINKAELEITGSIGEYAVKEITFYR